MKTKIILLLFNFIQLTCSILSLITCIYAPGGELIVTTLYVGLTSNSIDGIEGLKLDTLLEGIEREGIVQEP